MYFLILLRLNILKSALYDLEAVARRCSALTLLQKILKKNSKNSSVTLLIRYSGITVTNDTLKLGFPGNYLLMQKVSPYHWLVN